MADIDLNNLEEISSGNFEGSNWEPIGYCNNASGNYCRAPTGQLFNTRFDGNDYTISNLIINTTERRVGVGLFGVVAIDKSISNVHLRNVSITAPNGLSVGGLIGVGAVAFSPTRGVKINSVSVEVTHISSLRDEDSAYVGGLIGDGRAAEISSSSAIVNQLTITSSIDENSGIGGLAGSAGGVTISSSHWDNETLSFVNLERGADIILAEGPGQTTPALKNPTANPDDGTFPGIYADWDNGYCNPTTGEYMTVADGDSEPDGFQRAWNLGGTNDYPVLNCFPIFTPAEQRAAITRVLAIPTP